MNTKSTVNLSGCSFQIGYAAAIAEAVYANVGAVFICTSAHDSIHGTSSRHHDGEAIDGRTRTLSAEQGNKVIAELRRRLEPLGFDVVDERGKPGSPHVHIEFQPKAGEHFITIVP